MARTDRFWAVVALLAATVAACGGGDGGGDDDGSGADVALDGSGGDVGGSDAGDDTSTPDADAPDAGQDAEEDGVSDTGEPDTDDDTTEVDADDDTDEPDGGELDVEDDTEDVGEDVVVVRGPGCAEGITAQPYPNEDLVGCAASVPWDDAEEVCGEGWYVCGAAEYVELAGDSLPESHYWTSDVLRYDGSSLDCTADFGTGYYCGDDVPMRICANYETGLDAQGNDCNWQECRLTGYQSAEVVGSFGGCDDDITAGVACCFGGTNECILGTDTCSDNEICVDRRDGFDCVDIDDSFYNAVDGSCRVLESGDIECDCEPGNGWAGYGCEPLPNPCANPDTAQVIVPGSIAGCGGSVTYTDRNSLCASGFQACEVGRFDAAVAGIDGFEPEAHYWLETRLGYVGGGPNDCAVGDPGAVGYNDCGDETPMRVCAFGAPGSDPSTDTFGNLCNWWGCGYNTRTSGTWYGGCSGNPTAGTMCCIIPL